MISMRFGMQVMRRIHRHLDLRLGLALVLVATFSIVLLCAGPLSSETRALALVPTVDASPPSVDETQGATVAIPPFDLIAAPDSEADPIPVMLPTMVVAACNYSDPAVADFVCDGTDDQVEIQAAISALDGKPGTVTLLDGTFYISSSILADHYLTLEGMGNSSLLYLVDNSDCDVISNLGGRYVWQSNVTIRRLKIDGNKANQSGGNGIRRTGPSAVFEDLTVDDCYLRGISHSWGDNTTISNNTISNCNGRGIFLGESYGGEIAGNTVYNCGLIESTEEDRAIDVYHGGDNDIKGNLVVGGGAERQIGAWDSPHVEIVGNTLRDGLGMGVAPHSPYARIIRNTITNAGNNAIDLCGENDCWVEGNTISHVDRIPLGAPGQENSGICVNSSRSTIVGNNIEFCGRAGIHIGPGNNDNQILNNVIYDSGQQGGGQAGIWVQIWTTDAINSGTIIQGNTCFDDQSVKTQKYGVLLMADSGYIDNIVVEDNDLRGNGIAATGPYDSARVRNTSIKNNLH